MPVLAFPGPTAPSLPSVTVEVPEGWDARPAGSDLLRARGTGAAGEPVEVAVRSHTGPVGYAVTDLVDALADGASDGAADDVSRLVVATGRVRGATLDADHDVLQSVLETLVVGGA